MDACFCSRNIFWNACSDAIAKRSKTLGCSPGDCWIPIRYISTFQKLGADVFLTVHYEACTHLHRTLQTIKAEGMKAGVALNPHTNVDLLEDNSRY